MKKIKFFLLSRKSILIQILLILLVVFIGYAFPQQISTSPANIEKWRDAHPSLAIWADRFGLDHVYTTPWFAIILFFFLLSLIVSTCEQIRKSFYLTFANPPTPPFFKGEDNSPLSRGVRGVSPSFVKGDARGFSGQKEGITTHISEEALISAIKKKGYISIGKQDAIKRFVKHPWGYWGNVLLHLGLMLIIASSLFIFLTQKRGLLQLVEEEIYFPGNPWVVEEEGLLAKDFILPEAIRLDKVNFEFYESDSLKSLSTAINFIDPQGRFKKYSVGINQIVTFKGVRIYQGSSFGHAFFVELTDEQGMTEKIILNIDHPIRRDRPSYKDFQTEGIPYSIRAHYYVNADRKSMNSANPLLNMLIIEKENSVKEVSLKIGESRKLGPYTARLVHVSRWSELIFVKDPGMSGIFSSFLIIIIGIMLTYFMPPREFFIKKEEDRLFLVWRPSKFERFYEDEFKEVCKIISGTNAA